MNYSTAIKTLEKELPGHKFRVKKGPVLFMDGKELPFVFNPTDEMLADLNIIQVMKPAATISHILINYLARQIKAKVNL